MSYHWEDILRSFLKEAGLVRALHGLGEDLLVLSPEWERQNVSPALGKLTYDLQVYYSAHLWCLWSRHDSRIGHECFARPL
ncbi:hypothetical protein SISSUDRAFT_1041481 [Sistotremastrum suecicum HHB10207 ss-3]|uniref:Uncharacterized protein n=1 Tax=Sistotremastrum suecicum HHB10207 ss-3 TaxID=1314776 RepID=A0A166HAR5_9AGAM|nr:hypothetical protein SISSUDRAFT_1041481 [Sistotremastrum suecicum HHB10207 ss-3]